MIKSSSLINNRLSESGIPKSNFSPSNSQNYWCSPLSRSWSSFLRFCRCLEISNYRAAKNVFEIIPRRRVDPALQSLINLLQEFEENFLFARFSRQWMVGYLIGYRDVGRDYSTRSQTFTVRKFISTMRWKNHQVRPKTGFHPKSADFKRGISRFFFHFLCCFFETIISFSF